MEYIVLRFICLFSRYLILTLLFSFCYHAEPTATYKVHYLAGNSLKLDGRLQASQWNDASIESDFNFPWIEKTAPITEFRALYNISLFFFSCYIEDSGIVVEDDFKVEHEVVRKDRVEIFFTKDKNLAEYYEIEIDPYARVLDYAAPFYRQIDNSWECEGLKTASAFSDSGYIVEGAIPLTTLEKLGLLNNSKTLIAGFLFMPNLTMERIRKLSKIGLVGSIQNQDTRFPCADCFRFIMLG